MEKNSCSGKHFKERRNWTLIFVIALIVVAFVFYLIQNIWLPAAQIEDGKLVRNFDDIIRHLPDEPDNLKQIPYESNIPNIIQKDIENMLNSEDFNEIVYKNKESRYSIIITVDDDENPIISFDEEESFSHYHGVKYLDFSMYQNDNDLIIYVRCPGTRRAERIILDENGIEDDYSFSYNESIDLFGVGKSDDFDGIHLYSSYLTLARKGNEFKFFQQGVQKGETITFPGSSIIYLDYCYILDSNNDVYYMYRSYSDEPWVKFVKVATCVDKVTDELACIDYDCAGRKYTISLPIYVVNGKNYVAIPDVKTTLAYGTNHGLSTETIGKVSPNYSFRTVEISESTLQEIAFDNVPEGISDSIYLCANYIYDEESGLYVERTIIDGSNLEALKDRSVKPDEYQDFIGEIIDLLLASNTTP